MAASHRPMNQLMLSNPNKSVQKKAAPEQRLDVRRILSLSSLKAAQWWIVVFIDFIVFLALGLLLVAVVLFVATFGL